MSFLLRKSIFLVFGIGIYFTLIKVLSSPVPPVTAQVKSSAEDRTLPQYEQKSKPKQTVQDNTTQPTQPLSVTLSRARAASAGMHTPERFDLSEWMSELIEQPLPYSNLLERLKKQGFRYSAHRKGHTKTGERMEVLGRIGQDLAVRYIYQIEPSGKRSFMSASLEKLVNKDQDLERLVTSTFNPGAGGFQMTQNEKSFKSWSSESDDLVVWAEIKSLGAGQEKTTSDYQGVLSRQPSVLKTMGSLFAVSIPK